MRDEKRAVAPAPALMECHSIPVGVRLDS